MVNTEEYLELISELEYIVAKHCSTENLMNGENYRYPVHYKDNGKGYVQKGNGKAKIPDGAVPSLEYRFGSHTLEIGKALDEILTYLVENYDREYIPIL